MIRKLKSGEYRLSAQKNDRQYFLQGDFLLGICFLSLLKAKERDPL